jgi:hypothetical protein
MAIRDMTGKMASSSSSSSSSSGDGGGGARKVRTIKSTKRINI